MRSLLLPSLLLVSALISAQGERSELRPDPVGTRLLDLDGDGALDLLVQHGDGSLLVRRNAGPRRFLDVVQELPRVPVTDVLCGDLDGDARPDLYLVSPGADVALLGLGDGRFREATEELGLAESGAGIRAERLDVDGDGLLDLVLHNQGSDVLFWARADGRFEREARTSDGRGLAAIPGSLLVDPRQEVPGEEPTSDGVGSGGSRSLAGSPGASAGHLGAAVAPSPTSTTLPAFALPINFDAFYVNDDQNEVDSADVIDGSLTGADVSTSSGNVTFGGAATVTARKGVFGGSSVASGLDSTVSGGVANTASGMHSTVSGGTLNDASSLSSTVSGGVFNDASGYSSTVSGGGLNDASGSYSTVSGGDFNTASGARSTVAGGYSNTASGDYGFAAGRRAKANHQGAFVWGDSVNVDKPSSAADQFNVYSEGGARIFAVGQTTPSMVVAADGRVGIGTAAPARMVHVQNGSSGATPTSNSSLVVESSTEASISLVSPASQEASLFLGNPTSGANAGAVVFNPFGGILTNGLALRTANTNRLAITASGNVGIGTDSPSERLTISTALGSRGFVQRAGTVAVGTYANGSGGWYGTFSNDDLIFFVNNSFGDAVLTAAGDFGIGTLSPAFKLEVNGSAHRVDNSSTWTVTSDERLKKNIHDLEGALETVLALRGVTFEYKDPARGQGLRRGFIAQEVEKVLPEWVEEGEDGYRLLNMNGFEALAVEALRELRDENAELRAANEALGARVAALESLESELASLKQSVASLVGTR